MASGFVSEVEIEEKRAKRQEEWDKVRKEEDPQEAPDEPYDHRSLFERLEEQRQKKQMEWDEEHKFKNQFRGLDDDEVDFLDKIDDIRTEAERQRIVEEKRELQEYQNKQQIIKEQELEERLRHEIKGPEIRRSNSTSGASSGGGGGGSKSKQQQLLLGAVKRKSGADPAAAKSSGQNDAKKSKPSDSQNGNPKVQTKPSTDSSGDKQTNNGDTCGEKIELNKPVSTMSAMGLLAAYSDSDSEEES